MPVGRSDALLLSYYIWETKFLRILKIYIVRIINFNYYMSFFLYMAVLYDAIAFEMENESIFRQGRLRVLPSCLTFRPVKGKIQDLKFPFLDCDLQFLN